MNIYKILIIDDSIPILTSLKKVLESNNYNVEISTNGHDAIKRLTENKYNLVLSDIQMPNMSGLDLLERIHTTIDEKLPVILMTGEDRESFAIKAIQLGASDYVKKPFDLDRLLRSISLQIANSLKKENNFQFLKFTDDIDIKMKFNVQDYIDNNIISSFNDFLNLSISFTAALKNTLSICLDEMISNAFIHSIMDIGHKRDGCYNFDEEINNVKDKYLQEKVELDISVSLSKKTIKVSVFHDGEGFDYNEISDKSSDFGDQISGRGLFILKNLVDKFYFEDGGRRVTIQKKYE